MSDSRQVSTGARLVYGLVVLAAGCAALALAFRMMVLPSIHQDFARLVPSANGWVPSGPLSEHDTPRMRWRVVHQKAAVELWQINTAGRSGRVLRRHPAGWRIERNDHGQTTRMEALNEAGVVLHRIEFERQEDRLTLRHLNPDGTQTRGRFGLSTWIPLTDEPTAGPPVEQFVLGADGALARGSWLGHGGQPVPASDGSWGASYTWTADGQPRARTALDAQGQPTARLDGVTTERLDWRPDDSGTPSRRHFVGSSGEPVAHVRGFAEVQTEFVAAGVAASTAFLDVNGQPVIDAETGCARLNFVRDRRAWEIHCQGVDGVPRKAASGWSIFRAEYDSRGYLTARVQLDSDRHPADVAAARVEVACDDAGREVRTGPAFDASGKQVPLPGRASHVVELTYDDQGRAVDARYLDARGLEIPKTRPR